MTSEEDHSGAGGHDEAVMRYEVRGAIAIATMNRPDQRNAQNTALIDALDDALARAESDDDVRVFILAAAGNHWSAGHDLRALVDPSAVDRWRTMRETPEGKLYHEQKKYVDPSLRLYHFPKPTIASLQGACVAAGLMWAAMCDIIVAADDAYFSNPVLRMTGAGVELLVEPWEIGFRKAKEFLLTGDKIDAQEAWRLGLVNRVVPRAELESATIALAEQIALIPPITAQMVKASINEAAALGGKEHSWKYHFMTHHFVHNTKTALDALDRRKSLGSMRRVFEDSSGGNPAGTTGGEPA
jgi:enoyl-CoA hydratase